MIYTVSYVVIGNEKMGGIQNHKTQPQAGDIIRLGQQTFEIVEVIQISPPRDDFQFLHATLREIANP